MACIGLFSSNRPRIGEIVDFVRHWKRGSDTIQACPGALGSKLFWSDDPGVLFATADWRNKGDRDAALAALEQRPDAEETLHGHEEFVEEWSVVACLELVSESRPPC